METISRNALCPCGSGIRYKHCCGLDRNVLPTHSRALVAHQQGALREAESLYRQALAENPEDSNVMSTLGLLLLERMRYREALELTLEATERSGWVIPGIRESLCKVMAKMLTSEANNRQKELFAETLVREENCHTISSSALPLVSVVLLANNHARFVMQAITSVLAQTYPNIEFIVIDNGSADDTIAMIKSYLRGTSVPVRFVTSENQIVPIALNMAAAKAQGQYLSFLNADDYYAPDRVRRLVNEIAHPGNKWGFSLISTIQDSLNSDITTPFDTVDHKRQIQRQLLGRASYSFAFLAHNVLVSVSNLFVERNFFLSLGGFSSFHYFPDLDFALRASCLSEPLAIRESLCFYREHERKTELLSRNAIAEVNQVLSNFMTAALSDTTICCNPLAPQWPGNRVLLLREALANGLGGAIPVEKLKDLATDLLNKTSQLPNNNRTVSDPLPPQKTALVVLGMHRSGTSALSRVLNLCGASLPEKLLTPKHNNPRGFWEPEDVIDLNERTLRLLGGAWHRVGFDLPMEGDLVETFVDDAVAMLASEYGDHETILIKDPRICVLAPLWHKALLAAGYRPAYVVPVRNPMEVAQSLHARGDMSVPEGLALWLSYMQRVMKFAATYPDVMYIRFADLLDNWRGVIGRIAERLELPLDIESHADQVDSFLEPSLRRQTSEDTALNALPEGPVITEICTLYKECVARSEQSSRLESNLLAEAVSQSPSNWQADPAATASFVLCIENNAIREQALLLCESIRRFGGRHSNAPILAFSPRPGLGVDAPTRRALTNMGVEYVDEPLNRVCPEYGSANRVFAAAWAENHADTDFIVVLDSDTIFLDEPALPLDADVAVRPVDSKGSATSGLGDPFEDYWNTLAKLCGISVEQLPYLQTTIDKERIRASYNGGLIVTRRNLGILSRWADLFARSVNEGMRPYGGHGMNIHASTGHVGHAASEYWGSNQAALALTIWATTQRVVHYPDTYNIPLHLITSEGKINQKWQLYSPVHLHYHWMFEHRHHEIALELIEQLGVKTDRLEWLAQRIPFAR